MIKTFKNLHLCKQKVDDLESWYAAFATQVLPSVLIWWPSVDLDLFYGKVKFGPLCFCMGQDKTMDFSETLAVYDIKVGRWSQQNEYMKLYEYQRSRSFKDLGSSHSDSIFLNFFSSIIARPIEAKFYVALSRDRKMEVTSNGLGHMTKMATMPIHGKNLKIFFWTKRLMTFKLGMQHLVLK